MWASPEDLRDTHNPRATEAIAAASHILWALSGRKFSGTHNAVEMYDTRSGLGDENWRENMSLQGLLQIEGMNAVCSNCGFPHRMRLRHQPVQRVLSVELNGEVVPTNQWALLNHSTLGFPYSHLACTAMCATVTYVWGVNPPAGGRSAAAALADQFLLAWDQDDDCKLPQRVTNVTRQGVSWTILDAQDFLDEGKTGIYTIDLFLRAVNPDKARRPARVFSPDVARAATVVQETAPPSIELTTNDLGLIAPGQPAWFVAPAFLWPGYDYVPYAVIDGTRFNVDHFTQNTDSSWTLSLSGSETIVLSDGDVFQLYADPDLSGSDALVVDGVVRFMGA